MKDTSVKSLFPAWKQVQKGKIAIIVGFAAALTIIMCGAIYEKMENCVPALIGCAVGFVVVITSLCIWMRSVRCYERMLNRQLHDDMLQSLFHTTADQEINDEHTTSYVDQFAPIYIYITATWFILLFEHKSVICPKSQIRKADVMLPPGKSKNSLYLFFDDKTINIGYTHAPAQAADVINAQLRTAEETELSKMP